MSLIDMSKNAEDIFGKPTFDFKIPEGMCKKCHGTGMIRAYGTGNQICGGEKCELCGGTGKENPENVPYKGLGYHNRKIEKGIFGEFSKIKEEVEELEDALEQGVRIMAMTELSDLYGAIEEFAHKKYGLSMEDLKKMSNRTKKAFREGVRK